MKWIAMTLMIVFALVMGFTGAFELFVKHFGGEELAANLWKPFTLPQIYMIMLIGIIIILVITVKIKSRGRRAT